MTRTCPSCRGDHPVGTTCGWLPVVTVSPALDEPGTSRWDGAVVVVTISDAEARRADDFAAKVEALRANTPSVFETANRVTFRRLSTRAEVGLARFLGLPWTGGSVLVTGRQHLPDVGRDIEVRWTGSHLDAPWLMLQKRERPYAAERWVLVTGPDRTFRYHGWLYGHEAMRPDNWDADMPYPCFRVPVARLRSMRDLT